MTQINVPWLVISDLDGTILNHHTYDLDATRTRMVQCREMGMPVVLNTSKTYQETVEIREELGINDPFIVENGSCIYFPVSASEKADREGYREQICGCGKAEISGVLEQLQTPAELYTRLSQCTVAQAVELTGLKPEQAEKAVAREFSEPLIWLGSESELEHFQQELREHGLNTLQGGRFLHVVGDCDKGRASQLLRARYGDNARIIALGDSPNDAAMLKVADIACIISSPSSEKLAQMTQTDFLSSEQAPQGWAEAVGFAINTIQQNDNKTS